MLIVDYSNEVLDELYLTHDGSFPFPDFDDPTFIQKKVVIENGRIVGCGLAKLTTEFILILNRNESRRTRVFAIDAIQRKLIFELKKRGIRDTHIFVNDPTVSHFAEHAGFKKCPEKEVLSLRFGYE